MADIMSKERRSWLMSRIHGRNTKPEVMVRSLLHRAGYRFSLQRTDLPGKPDVVLPKHQTVIFVHGCFWHRHKGCKQAATPKTRKAFWETKLAANVARDLRNQRELRRLGWRVIVVWECDIEQRVEKVMKVIDSIRCC